MEGSHMEIGKKLKDARTEAGLTQEKVAEKIMVSRQTVSNWENGKSLPDIASILKLSVLYQVSLDDLLKGDARMKKKVEKDVKIAKAKDRVLVTSGLILLAIGSIYLASVYVGGGFHDFCTAAIPYVILGVLIAGVFAIESIKDGPDKDDPDKDRPKELQ